MNLQQFMALALDPSRILRAQGMTVDPWQRDFLFAGDRYVLLNCCRQAGKSTVTAALALHHALFEPGSLGLIVSPGQRQSSELYRKVLDGYLALGQPVRARHRSQHRLELVNGSRIVCLPGREETVRCFSPSLLLIDEASRVADDLYRSVRPMLAVSQGRLIALSTPFGQRGWFHREWTGTGLWKRVEITWRQCPRITPAFLEEERVALGPEWVAQEYECRFTAREGLVYPDFEACLSDQAAPAGKALGGIDWGWRNPFAAVWGVLDRDDVLWITNERYLRATALHEHARALPRVMWYCDPAGPTEMEEFRVAGHTLRAGINDIRLGIAAVTARLRTGRLRVDPVRCPNLVQEARLYRYPGASERAVLGENPVDEHNHALGALRYLVSRLDARFLARLRHGPRTEHPDSETPPVAAKRSPLHSDDSLWTTLP